MAFIETNQLTGVALDWAVATAEGWTLDYVMEPNRLQDGWGRDLRGDPGPDVPSSERYWKKDGGVISLLGYGDMKERYWKPSVDWELGGPIIAREMLGVMPTSDAWWRAGDVDGANGFGPTALIAAMRCFVCAKLGDTVDIPPDLL